MSGRPRKSSQAGVMATLAKSRDLAEGTFYKAMSNCLVKHAVDKATQHIYETSNEDPSPEKSTVKNGMSDVDETEVKGNSFTKSTAVQVSKLSMMPVSLRPIDRALINIQQHLNKVTNECKCVYDGCHKSEMTEKEQRHYEMFHQCPCKAREKREKVAPTAPKKRSPCHYVCVCSQQKKKQLKKVGKCKGQKEVIRSSGAPTSGDKVNMTPGMKKLHAFTQKLSVIYGNEPENSIFDKEVQARLGTKTSNVFSRRHSVLYENDAFRKVSSSISEGSGRNKTNAFTQKPSISENMLSQEVDSFLDEEFQMKTGMESSDAFTQTPSVTFEPSQDINSFSDQEFQMQSGMNRSDAFTQKPSLVYDYEPSQDVNSFLNEEFQIKTGRKRSEGSTRRPSVAFEPSQEVNPSDRLPHKPSHAASLLSTSKDSIANLRNSSLSQELHPEHFSYGNYDESAEEEHRVNNKKSIKSTKQKYVEFHQKMSTFSNPEVLTMNMWMNTSPPQSSDGSEKPAYRSCRASERSIKPSHSSLLTKSKDSILVAKQIHPPHSNKLHLKCFYDGETDESVDEEHERFRNKKSFKINCSLDETPHQKCLQPKNGSSNGVRFNRSASLLSDDDEVVTVDAFKVHHQDGKAFKGSQTSFPATHTYYTNTEDVDEGIRIVQSQSVQTEETDLNMSYHTGGQILVQGPTTTSRNRRVDAKTAISIDKNSCQTARYHSLSKQTSANLCHHCDYLHEWKPSSSHCGQGGNSDRIQRLRIASRPTTMQKVKEVKVNVLKAPLTKVTRFHATSTVVDSIGTQTRPDKLDCGFNGEQGSLVISSSSRSSNSMLCPFHTCHQDCTWNKST